ncbi:MAG: hypothetical protein J6Z14_05585 [Prevotella sp.]|nr:hypothetical protein [Prevotella sp.]
MGFRRIILGEPMPDKNDPKYRERYEREVAAGRKFADAVGISWLARVTHTVACRNKMLFLVVVFGIVLACFTYNVITMVKVYNKSNKGSNAVEQVDRAMREQHPGVSAVEYESIKPSYHE